METTGRTDTGRVTNAIARLVPKTAPTPDADADDPHAERRALTNGFGDALAKAFEMAATPAVFGVLGWLLDRWLGTAPLFLLAFVVIVFVYECWKLAYGYSATMAEHEAKVLGTSRAAGEAPRPASRPLGAAGRRQRAERVAQESIAGRQSSEGEAGARQ